MRIVAVGNANVDLLVYVNELPEAGGRIEAKAFEKRPGGAASNFAVAVAKLGAKSAFLGCVGRDVDGDWLLRELEGAGVDVSCVERVSEPTGVAFIFVDAKGERTMIVYRGANALLLQYLKGRGLPPSDWVHAASVPPEVAVEAFEAAKMMGARTSYDPGSTYVRSGWERLKEALKKVDVLFLNESEASALACSAGGGLEEVRNLVQTVVVKRGSRGSMVWAGGTLFEAEAFKVDAVDTTGAGDVYDAAFVLATLWGFDCGDALTFANACAAVKVTRKGAQSGPTLAEVSEFLRARGLHQLASRLPSERKF